MPIHISNAASQGTADAGISVSSDDVIIKAGTSNKDIIFQVNDGGSADTEVMRVDGSESAILIGGANAGSLAGGQLCVQGNLSLNKNGSGTAAGCELTFCKSRHDTIGSHTAVQVGDILGEIAFKGSDGDSSSFAASIQCKVGAIAADGSSAADVGDGDMPGKLVFSTTQDGADGVTEAMRINQGQGVVLPNGSLAIMGINSGREVADSTTNAYSGLQISYGHRGVTGRGGIVVRGQNNTTVGTFGVTIEEADAQGANDVMIIATNGNATFTGTVSDGSDARIKTNIRSLSDNTLAKVMQLRPVNYNRINQSNDDEQSSAEYTGFVAQEVEEIFPDMVHTTELAAGASDTITDFKSLAQKELIAVLTKAIQEQQEIIETLQQKVEDLEEWFEALEG